MHFIATFCTLDKILERIFLLQRQEAYGAVYVLVAKLTLCQQNTVKLFICPSLQSDKFVLLYVYRSLAQGLEIEKYAFYKQFP